MKSAIVLLFVLTSGFALAQRDPGSLQYTETNPSGGPDIVVWRVEALKSVTSGPSDWPNVQ